MTKLLAVGAKTSTEKAVLSVELVKVRRFTPSLTITTGALAAVSALLSAVRIGGHVVLLPESTRTTVLLTLTEYKVLAVGLAPVNSK